MTCFPKVFTQKWDPLFLNKTKTFLDLWPLVVASPYIFFFPSLVFSKKWSGFILFTHSTLCWKLCRVDKVVLRSFGIEVYSIMNLVLVVTAKKFITGLMDRAIAHLPGVFLPWQPFCTYALALLLFDVQVATPTAQPIIERVVLIPLTHLLFSQSNLSSKLCSCNS